LGIGGSVSDRNLRLLEKLILYIPGFHGYKERELRREEDKRLRDKIVAELEDVRYELLGLEEEYFNDVKKLKEVEDLFAKLGKIRDKVEHADYGYSGFFDKQINEEELTKIYQHDLKMFESLEGIKKEEDFRKLKTLFQAFEKEFDEREKICM
jgi:hypothetical protein